MRSTKAQMMPMPIIIHQTVTEKKIQCPKCRHRFSPKDESITMKGFFFVIGVVILGIVLLIFCSDVFFHWTNHEETLLSAIINSWDDFVDPFRRLW